MENQDIWKTISVSENSDNIPWDKIVTTHKVDNIISVIPRREIATIKIKYLPGAPRMEKIEKGNWIDCFDYEDVTLKAGERAYINLGFACQLPEGYEAILAPRSSTFKRWKVLQTNSIGIIDSTFCSNSDIWMMPVLATEDVTIPKGTRLCQFRIQKSQPDIVFEEVEDLHNKQRGGLGSTGA